MNYHPTIQTMGDEECAAAILSGTITEFEDLSLTQTKQGAFQRCRALKKLIIPSVQVVGYNSVSETESLKEICIPYATIAGSGLSGGGFPKFVYEVSIRIHPNALTNCTNLVALILKSVKDITPLYYTDCIYNTPIAAGTGYVYVPRHLIDQYKSATNWSAYATQFRVLQDYTVDGTIDGELDESKI